MLPLSTSIISFSIFGESVSLPKTTSIIFKLHNHPLTDKPSHDDAAGHVSCSAVHAGALAAGLPSGWAGRPHSPAGVPLPREEGEGAGARSHTGSYSGRDCAAGRRAVDDGGGVVGRGRS